MRLLFFCGVRRALARSSAMAVVVACLIAFTAFTYSGQAIAAELTYKLEPVKVAKGTWVVYGKDESIGLDNGGFIANSVIIEVPAGVVLICSGPSRRFGEQLLRLVQSLLPTRKIVRVFNTHHHPDHVFGNQVFGAKIIAATPGIIEAMKTEGEGLAENMYRLAGDWMRGTRLTVPAIALTQPQENVGGRLFSYFYRSGHTNSDLVIRDEVTGLLFAGDLVFHNRAAATPHANIGKWIETLDFIAGLKPTLVIPGHGPIDADGRAIAQTKDWLQWVDQTLRGAVRGGLTMNEAMQLQIPIRFVRIELAAEEFERSVVHLYQGLEDELYEPVEVIR